MKRIHIMLFGIVFCWMLLAAGQDGPYLVIDLSGGASAPSYPISFLGGVPDGGWTDEYKTTKLVLRSGINGGFGHKCGSESA